MTDFTPHDYQARGIRLLTGNSGGAGLLLDPGMGKTIICLQAFEILRMAGHASKMLIIVPLKPMYGTWRQEAEKWGLGHLTFSIVHGKDKEARLNEDADVHLINPEGVQWLCDRKPLWPKWDVLVVDESTKFKSSNSKRFKAMKKSLPSFSYRWILTGTFTPNGLMDLFSQVYIMDNGEALGKYITHFRNRYFFQSGFGGYSYTPFEGAPDIIAEKIAPMTLRLLAEDYLNMPEFNKIIRPVELPEEAMKKYREVEKEFITALQSGTIVAANAAAAGTKCRQMANGAVYDDTRQVHELHTAKMQALDEIVEETSGHPLLIIYEFAHDRERIMAELGKGAVCTTGLTGRTFEQVQDDFNLGLIPYLVVHSGNTHGLNIQGNCFHMVWFGITWNLESYVQTVWRLYRQGQASKMVLCYMLVATGTLDEKVVLALDHKQAEQSALDLLLMNHEVVQ